MYDKVQSKIEDSGVSPVIGVILMVAVTVALVALVTVIVFDIGGDVSESPDATVNIKNDSGAVKATVLRNENVDSFTLQVQTDDAGQETYSIGSEAGASKTIPASEKTSVNDEVVNYGSMPLTDGESIAVDTGDVVSIENVEYDPSGADSGPTDVTSDFSITGSTQLTYSGSDLTDPSSGDDFNVDYTHTTGTSETYTEATVIATMSDGSQQVLTSSDL
jgi:flagellin-like protein